ncbi:MAG: glycosyltransferase family 2 protein [bacterium]|nr:glycosyltransferase family 2 protein [bacterium]
MEQEKYYLNIGNANDLKNPRERLLYRAFEILPGALAWLTLSGIFIGSWLAPVGASIFIILFDLYWLIKTFFLSLHLRASYKKMKEHIRTDWQKKLSELEAYRTRTIYHLIILPFFREEEQVVRESVESLARSSYQKDRIMVVLGIEERAGKEAEEIAEKLSREFGNVFFKFFVARHPAGVAGELMGKGANETWAIRRAKETLIDPLRIPYEDIVVSSFDIDTKASPDYFSCLTYHYCAAPDALHTSYQPIPVYNNNIWSAPAVSRVVATSGTFWQMMQQARPERLTTFSSHSMPFKALVDMDYWPTNIVSEDSRIFWKSLLFYDGKYRVVPLYYSVSMDANVAPTLWGTIKNVYKQQRRWGWGVENVPYMLFGFFRNRAIPLRTKLYFTFNQFDGFWSWSTNSFLIFLLGWLPPFIGGQVFGSSSLAYNLPFVTRFLMTLAMFGLITSAILSTMLLPPRPPRHPFRKYLWMVGQWTLLPFIIVTLGSLPGLDAQTRLMFGRYMGFWVTPKYRNKYENPKAG